MCKYWVIFLATYSIGTSILWPLLLYLVVRWARDEPDEDQPDGRHRVVETWSEEGYRRIEGETHEPASENGPARPVDPERDEGQ